MRPYLAIAVLAPSLFALGQQQPAAPASAEHPHEVNRRGDTVMGFSHLKTTHHFRLFRDGGEIEVLADDPADTATRDQIRMHLDHIAKMFAAGDFEAPMLIHATTPPGVPVMKKLWADIVYTFQPTARGGRSGRSLAGGPATRPPPGTRRAGSPASQRSHTSGRAGRHPAFPRERRA